MAIGVRINETKGVVSTNNSAGLTVERSNQHVGFAPYKVYNTNDLTTNTTLVAGDAGVTTLSGVTGPLTIVLPLASTCPGAIFTLRSLAAQKHVITASQESGLGRVICNMPTITSSQQLVSPLSGASGSNLTFGAGNSAATIGTSVSLLCDGISFLILGGSGSLSLA